MTDLHGRVPNYQPQKPSQHKRRPPFNWAKLFIILCLVIGGIWLFSNISDNSFISPGLVKLLVIGSVVGWSFYLSSRMNLFKDNLKYGAIWIVIIGAITAVYYMWEGYKQSENYAHNMQQSPAGLMVHRSSDGHFWLSAKLNNTTLPILIDTGASHVVLSPKDAKSIGIDVDALNYEGVANTANGPVNFAVFHMQTFQLGDYLFHNVPVMINSAEMGGSLLGMSVLNKFESIEFKQDKLILKK